MVKVMFLLNENKTVTIVSNFGGCKFKINDELFENIVINESSRCLYLGLFISLIDVNVRRNLFDFSDYQEKECLFDMKNDIKKMLAEKKRIKTLEALEELNELNIITLGKVGYLIRNITLNHPSQWRKNFKAETKKNFLDYEYN